MHGCFLLMHVCSWTRKAILSLTLDWERGRQRNARLTIVPLRNRVSRRETVFKRSMLSCVDLT